MKAKKDVNKDLTVDTWACDSTINRKTVKTICITRVRFLHLHCLVKGSLWPKLVK